MVPSNQELDFTVAICTYNGASRLPYVLDTLRRQKNVEDLEWEVVVVDNNSSDGTADIVLSYQADWPDECVLRYEYEPMPGKTNAVKRAIASGRGRLIGFLDDDNVPDEHWVAAAIAFAEAHPRAGAFGGRILPDYEGRPPDNIDAIEVVFAIVRYEEFFQYPRGGPLGRMFAPGAGLVFRKQAWFESVPARLKLSGPLGSSSLGLHEEMEVQWHLYKHGWEIWHNPEMRIQHRIPPTRFDEQYLMRFFKELALSRYKYRMLTYPWWQRPAATVGYMGSDLAKLTRSLIAYYASSNHSLSLRCRLHMQKYLLISPLYVGLMRWK